MILTNVEAMFLIHLLSYADEELFVYSSNFLTKHGVKLEDTNVFIHNLMTKIQNNGGDEV